MASGVILLVLIAALITFGLTRVRRRMGMSSTRQTWVTAMLVIIFFVLILWVTQTH